MESQPAESLLARYAENYTLRALIQLIPFGIGSAADIYLIGSLSEIRADRSEVFFDELAKGVIEIDESKLHSEDFIHKFLTTTRAALGTRRREKIRLFARLLKSPLAEDVDIYEDYLKILDELSYRELRALAILDGFSGYPRNSRDNELQWTNTFWDEFVSCLGRELQIRSDEANDFMNRIARTGCYEVFTGAFMDYTGGRGKITPTYYTLKRLIYSEL